MNGLRIFFEQPKTGWWFQIFFIFTPDFGEDEPILTSIFFKGVVQPPTRKTSQHPLGSAKKPHRQAPELTSMGYMLPSEERLRENLVNFQVSLRQKPSYFP